MKHKCFTTCVRRNILDRAPPHTYPHAVREHWTNRRSFDIHYTFYVIIVSINNGIHFHSHVIYAMALLLPSTSRRVVESGDSTSWLPLYASLLLSLSSVFTARRYKQKQKCGKSRRSCESSSFFKPFPSHFSMSSQCIHVYSIRAHFECECCCCCDWCRRCRYCVSQSF